MRVCVYGAGGATGRLVVDGLLDLGHAVVGVVRDPVKARALEAAGAEAVLADVTVDVAAGLPGCDAAVWLAGAGMGADPQQVDHLAAVAAQQAAATAGVARFVQVSSMGADRRDQAPPFLRAFLEAKATSDQALQASGLEWTLVRPGGLGDGPGTGHVSAAPTLPSGTVPRADVAAVVVTALDRRLAVHRAFDLTSGPTPVVEALAAL